MCEGELAGYYDHVEVRFRITNSGNVPCGEFSIFFCQLAPAMEGSPFNGP